jgi:hypothetical protein
MYYQPSYRMYTLNIYKAVHGISTKCAEMDIYLMLASAQSMSAASGRKTNSDHHPVCK